MTVFDGHNAAMSAAMDADLADRPTGEGLIFPPGVQQQVDPNFVMQQMMQNMQNMMQMFATSMQQLTQGQATQNAGMSSAAFSPQEPTHWREDKSLSNVRLDERAFRRIEKFHDKKEEWKEWRSQVLNAISECDNTFAEDLIIFEKKEDVITKLDLTPTQQQLSATLSSRLISLTGKEAFAIVSAAERQGVEAWRQLNQRFDPQTDARFALLLIALVSFKIGKTQDVQSGLVKWEAKLLELERDHNEKLSPKIRRTLLLNVLPSPLQARLLEQQQCGHRQSARQSARQCGHRQWQ